MTRSLPPTRRIALVTVAAAFAVAACEKPDTAIDTTDVDDTTTASFVVDDGASNSDDGDATPATAVTTAPSPVEAADAIGAGPVGFRAPLVQDAAGAQQSIARSEAQAVRFVEATDRVAVDRVDEDVIREWIAALTALEQALDADAIRALGDDPVLDQIADPIDDLDRSVRRVLDLLDPETGPPNYLAALVEAQAAVERWEAAAPGVEDAWADAVARWEAEWEAAVAEWEAEWEAAVAEWEAEWEAAVAEWEAEWEAAVAEWEAEWEAAVAEWEAEWEAAVAEWQREAAERRQP